MRLEPNIQIITALVCATKDNILFKEALLLSISCIHKAVYTRSLCFALICDMYTIMHAEMPTAYLKNSQGLSRIS